MFYEKRLISRSGPERNVDKSFDEAETPSSKAKAESEQKVGAPEKIKDPIQETATKLKKQIIDENILDFFSLGKNSDDHKKIMKIAEILKDTDAITEMIEEKLRKGYEYGGYSMNNLTWSWYKNGETFTEIIPIFYRKDVKKLLPRSFILRLKRQERKAEKEKFKNYLREQYSTINSGLKVKELIKKDLNAHAVRKSDFGNDIKPLIIASFHEKSRGGYSISYTKNGIEFSIKSKFLKLKGFGNVRFNLEDYDADLNYKKPKKQEQKPTDERQKIDEDFEKLQKKELIQRVKYRMPEQLVLERLRTEVQEKSSSLNPEECSRYIGELTEQMESLGQKHEKIGEFNAVIQETVESFENIIVDSTNEGVINQELILKRAENELGDFETQFKRMEHAAKTENDIELIAALSVYQEMIGGIFELIGVKYGIELD
jgi:hypothetical protein